MYVLIHISPNNWNIASYIRVIYDFLLQTELICIRNHLPWPRAHWVSNIIPMLSKNAHQPQSIAATAAPLLASCGWPDDVSARAPLRLYAARRRRRLRVLRQRPARVPLGWPFALWNLTRLLFIHIHSPYTTVTTHYPPNRQTHKYCAARVYTFKHKTRAQQHTMRLTRCTTTA